MNLKVRRIIYSIFIAFFLIVSPLLIFYALGFRYNFSKTRIEKTGVLFIKSYPRDASIFLNDELYKRQTPTQINRILANDYKTRVEKEGYFPWTKTLTVYPQTTTFVEDVTLFKNQLDLEPLLNGNFSDLLVSPNLSKLVLLKDDNNLSSIILYSLINNKEKFLMESNSDLELDSWCRLNRKVVAKNKSDHLVINTDSGKVTSFYDLSGYNFEQIKCDYFNDNIFYGLRNNGFYKINLLEKETALLTDEKVVSFLPWQTKIIYISAKENKYTLKSYSDQEIQDILVLPISDSYKFVPSIKNEIALIDQAEGIVYVIDPFNEQPFKRVLKNVSDFKWYDKQLIYWNDFELWIYYPESDESVLLERASSLIQNAFWHSGFVYVFGQIDNVLKVYELDSRDQRNVYELLNLPEITDDNIFVNKKGDLLYLITEVDSVPGFYVTEIQ